jgi:hypothetical protein
VVIADGLGSPAGILRKTALRNGTKQRDSPQSDC